MKAGLVKEGVLSNYCCNNPKFNVGDRVLVCQDLVTIIEEIQPIEDGSFIYWFKGEKGGLRFEYPHAIEIYNGSASVGSLLIS